MADRRPTPDYEDLPASRRSLWNSLMGLAAIAALFGVVGLFLPIVPAGVPFLVAAGAWFGARRAAMERFGIWDWIIAGLGTLLVITFFL